MDGNCLVMIGHDFNGNWSPQLKGVVCVGFKAAEKGKGVLSDTLNFEERLKKMALEYGANLVSDVTFVPLPTNGGDYSSPCCLMVAGNAYFIPELEMDFESDESENETTDGYSAL